MTLNDKIQKALAGLADDLWSASPIEDGYLVLPEPRGLRSALENLEVRVFDEFEDGWGFPWGLEQNGSERKSNGDEGTLVENPILSFCKSLVRRIHLRHPSAPQDEDKAAAVRAQLETCQTVHKPINRVTKQGRFDWGSFSAFEDGSIEVERAGIRQRFRNFSELKRSLNHRSEDEGSAATGTWRLGL